MTITEIIAAVGPIAKDCAAVAGTLGALAMALAHFPGMPAKAAEFFARFATYASQTFSVNRRDTLEPPAKPVAAPYVPERSRFINDKPDPPNDAAMRSTETLVHYTLSLAAFALLIGSALVSCTPAEVTVEKKTLADAQTAIDKYCDARDKYIVIEEPDAGVPVSADAGAKP